MTLEFKIRNAECGMRKRGRGAKRAWRLGFGAGPWLTQRAQRSQRDKPSRARRSGGEQSLGNQGPSGFVRLCQTLELKRVRAACARARLRRDVRAINRQVAKDAKEKNWNLKFQKRPMKTKKL